jgi:hypothetical protein
VFHLKNYSSGISLFETAKLKLMKETLKEAKSSLKYLPNT